MTTPPDGNANSRRDIQREARLGRARVAVDIPQQPGLRQRNGDSIVTPHDQMASYRIGEAERPSSIQHDIGFLKMGRRSATADDYQQLALWLAKLEAAEAIRPDLVDATAAYRHFLKGRGEARQFSYERYVMSDASGRLTLRNAILDLQHGVLGLYAANPKLRTFPITGTAIICGSSAAFPYPATENWHKAIGGHLIWLSGRVAVTCKQAAEPLFELSMTLHAEDRYNFNPGAADIATGIPDSANGRFEMTGLAHQYDQFATLTRVVTWRGALPGSVTGLSGAPWRRERQPAENRRLRNRL